MNNQRKSSYNKLIANTIVETIKNGNKIMVCGNGGSAAETQHFVAEMVGKFKHYRRALPFISLTTDTSILTSIGNDFGFKYVFSRQIEALGNEGDILLVLSTSGTSQNCMEAIQVAHKMGIHVIELKRTGTTTSEIQENQLQMIHQICEEVEKAFITPDFI